MSWHEDSIGVPDVSSLSWEETAERLFGFLRSAKSIDEVLAWADDNFYKHYMVKNMLAWLSFSGKVRFDGITSRWTRGSDSASSLDFFPRARLLHRRKRRTS